MRVRMGKNTFGFKGDRLQCLESIDNWKAKARCEAQTNVGPHFHSSILFFFFDRSIHLYLIVAKMLSRGGLALIWDKKPFRGHLVQ